MSVAHQEHPAAALTARQARGEVKKSQGCASPTGRGGNAASARTAGPISPVVVVLRKIVMALQADHAAEQMSPSVSVDMLREAEEVTGLRGGEPA